jgi:hypothetical protein
MAQGLLYTLWLLDVPLFLVPGRDRRGDGFFKFKEDEMKKTIKLFSLLASIALSGVFAPALADTAPAAAATPAAPTVVVGGMVDTYYAWVPSDNDVNIPVPGIFYNHKANSYTLGLAEVNVTATQGNASGHLTLAYGETSDWNAFGAGTGVVVQNAYVSYVADQWTFNAGKFVTWMGNEVIESKSNMNYSRSLLYQYTIPVFHTGLSVNFAPSSTFGVTGYAVDGWNSIAAIGTAQGEKSYGLQFSIKPDPSVSILVNGIAGPDPALIDGYGESARYVGELIASYAATDKLSFALDAEYGAQDLPVSQVVFTGDGSASTTITSKSFWGIALYGRYQIASDWAAALRLEEVKDSYAYLGIYGVTATLGTGYDTEAREGTLTVEHNFTPNLLMRVEGRLDMVYSGGTQFAPSTTVPSGPFGSDGSGSEFTSSASMVFSY